MPGDRRTRAVARNIEEVVRLEQEAERARPPSSRVADLIAGMAGTLWFVVGHAVVIAAWTAVNAHLDLQISLLAEQEVNKVLQMLERISRQMGIEDRVVDEEAHELARMTAVGDLAHDLHDRLPDR